MEASQDTLTGEDLGLWSLTLTEGAEREGEGGYYSGLPPAGFDAFGMWMSYEAPAAPSPTGSRPAAPAPAPPAPNGSAPPPATTQAGPLVGSGAAEGVVTLASRRVPVRGRTAFVRIACTGERPCAGSIRLGHGSRRAAFRLQAGQHGTVRIELSRGVAAAVRRHRHARTQLRLRTTRSGQLTEKRANVLLVSLQHRHG
jgi:hypothetical protein